MRVDGPDRVDASGASAPDGKPPRPPAKADQGQAGVPAEPAALDASYGHYVRKAADSEEVDVQAVAEARKLLESGRLDTEEAAQRAAKRIASEGI